LNPKLSNKNSETTKVPPSEHNYTRTVGQQRYPALNKQRKQVKMPENNTPIVILNKKLQY